MRGVLSAADLPAAVALVNTVARRPAAELEAVGIDVFDGPQPGSIAVAIDNAAACGGNTLLIVLASDGDWTARRPLNVERLDTVLKDAASRISHSVDHLTRGRRRDRDTMLRNLRTVSRWLLAEVAHIAEAEGKAPAHWQQIPEGEPVWGAWCLVGPKRAGDTA